MREAQALLSARHHRGPHDHGVGVELPLDIGEVVGENESAFGLQGRERSLNHVLGTGGTFGAADMAEDNDVVLLRFNVDGVEVARAELTTISNAVLERLRRGDVDHAG